MDCLVLQVIIVLMSSLIPDSFVMDFVPVKCTVLNKEGNRTLLDAKSYKVWTGD